MSAAVALVRLQLLARLGRDLLGGGSKLLLHSGEPLALGLAGGVEALLVERKARLGTRHQPFLPVTERPQLRRQRLLGPLDVVPQLAEALADPPLRACERLAQLGARTMLTLGERGPPLVGDPPLLGDELRERIGAGSRERPLELGRASTGFGPDDLVEASLRLLEPAVDLARAGDQALQCEHRELEGGADREAARHDRESCEKQEPAQYRLAPHLHQRDRYRE